MKIGLSGITKNVTETLKEDGQLDEMINLRHDGAALKTVGTPKDIKFVDTDGNAVSEVEEIVFVHVAADGKNWLSVKDGYLRFYGRENEDGNVVVEPVNVLLLDGDISDIDQTGNFIVIKTISLSFILYENSKYILLNPQEDLNISPEISGYYNYDLVQIEGRSDNADDEKIYYALKCGGVTPTKITEVYGKYREQGKLYNPVFVRLAFKMYDGNYIMHSIPVLLRPTRMYKTSYRPIQTSLYDKASNLRVECNIQTSTSDGEVVYANWICSLYFDYFFINIKLNKLNIFKYKDVISSLDVFICEVQQFDFTDKTYPDIKEYGNDILLYYSTFKGDVFSSINLRERLENASVYRKVKSYTLEEIATDIDEQLDLSKNSILLNLEAQDMLPDDEFSHNKVSGNIFMYNQKFHLSNLSTELFNGYDLKYFFNDAYNSEKEGKSSSTRLVENGFGLVKKIQKSGQLIDLSDNDYPLTLEKIEILYSFSNTEQSKIAKTLYTTENILQLHSFIAYPSADVKGVKVKVIFKDSSNTYYIAEQEFKAINSEVMNLSFLMNWEEIYIVKCIVGGGLTGLNSSYYETTKDINYYIKHIYLDKALPVATDSDYVSENTIVKDRNKIKVSSAVNPFYFPVEQTYEIGNGEIRNMAVATQALSSGQFGQFPVYVFCSDGIYALNVGDGEVTYNSSTPVSRDILTGGLVSIDDSIAFISDKKVMLLGGSKTKSISDVLCGDSFGLVIPETTYPIDDMCADAIGDSRFEEFVSDAKIHYNYFLREIYLTREGKEYMYVYDMTAGVWSKRCITSTKFIDSYPDLYLQEAGGDVKNLSSEQLADEATRHSVFLRTRPMLLSDNGFKKLSRLILRISFIGSIKVRILVSNDGVNYLPLADRYFKADCLKRDIPFGRASASYMYYIVEISGSLSERAYINFIELEIERSIFGNRLR